MRLAKESAAKDKEIEGLRIRLDNATRRLQDEIAEKQALAQEVHSLKVGYS